MPVNFNILQPLDNEKTGIVAQLPQSGGGGGGGGIGGLLSGIKGLIGGLSQGFGGNNASSPQQSPSMPNQPATGQSPPGSPSNQLFQPSNIAGSPNPGPQPGTGQSPPNGSKLAQLGQPGTPTPQGLIKSPAYQTAFQAYQSAKQQGLTNSPYMTVVDFSQPSTSKRLWVINPSSNQVMLNTFVAQGAPGFSNKPGSHQSSLGTFLTGATYNGDNGQSLRIQGLDKGINDNAASRDIVVHPAAYAASGGSSWGCFAVPPQDAQKLIALTQGGSIIHAYAPGSPGSTIGNVNFITNPQSATSILSNPNNNPFKPNQGTGGSQDNLGSSTSAGQSQQKPRNNSMANYNLPNANSNLSATMAGIAGVESEGAQNPYGLLSIKSRNGDRAYGKYQIMGNNIPSWTKQALGRSMTPQQFLADPQAQEQTAAFQLNQSLQQGYSPQDAASIWFSGRPQKQAGNASDAYGTTVPAYVRKFNQGYQNYQPTQQPSTPIQQAQPQNQDENQTENPNQTQPSIFGGQL